MGREGGRGGEPGRRAPVALRWNGVRPPLAPFQPDYLCSSFLLHFSFSPSICLCRCLSVCLFVSLSQFLSLSLSPSLSLGLSRRSSPAATPFIFPPHVWLFVYTALSFVCPHFYFIYIHVRDWLTSLPPSLSFLSSAFLLPSLFPSLSLCPSVSLSLSLSLSLDIFK